MKIQIKNLQKLKRINLVSLEKKIKKILKFLNFSNKTVYIVLCDNKLIKKLNKSFLKRNHSTDVIAFPLEDKYTGSLLGEVIVSAEEAVKFSKIYKTAFEEELVLYIIHGILHLLGYKDKTSQDREKMRRKEGQILEFIHSSGERRSAHR
jgi:probable rRNA maturation factor